MIPTLGHSGKVKTRETVKRPAAPRSWEEGEMDGQGTEGVQGSEDTPCDIIMVVMSL